MEQHPGIFMPTPLEVHFFDNETNFSRGAEWYANRFGDAGPNQVCGEKTPDYLWTCRSSPFHTDIAERIKSLVPDVKLLLVLRNPVIRAISAINHQIMKGRLSPSVSIEELIFGRDKPLAEKYGIIERGFYVNDLTRYLAFFPRENLKILLYEEDVSQAPHDTLRAVYEFVGVDSNFVPKGSGRRVNQGMRSHAGLFLNYHAPRLSALTAALDRLLPKTDPLKPSDETLERLKDLYRSKNLELEQLLARSIDAWQ